MWEKRDEYAEWRTSRLEERKRLIDIERKEREMLQFRELGVRERE
jgi:hypothetical protein